MNPVFGHTEFGWSLYFLIFSYSFIISPFFFSFRTEKFVIASISFTIKVCHSLRSFNFPIRSKSLDQTQQKNYIFSQAKHTDLMRLIRRIVSPFLNILLGRRQKMIREKMQVISTPFWCLLMVFGVSWCFLPGFDTYLST